jgi:nitrite reductase/ring-hydroxylating ferredoxin subunit
MIRAVSNGTLTHPRRLSRRSLIRGAFSLLAAPGAAAFVSMVSRQAQAWRNPHDVTIPADVRGPVAFVDEIVVCRTEGEVKVFSARCSHLGCRITGTSEGLLVCPCHGSKFRTDGTVAAGPAARPLELLPHRVDPRTGALIVHVS